MKSKNIFNIIISKIVQFLVIIHQKFYGLYVRLRREKNKTKVFCIGFSKTGTTSLDKALAILGYRNVHWLRGHLKPKIGWIDYIKKSPFDAFSDAPMYRPNLFKKIDKAFPNSKFILTVRKPEDLANSWSNYFNHVTWSFTNDDDKKLLMTMYKKHNNEVIEYFKDKPSKLLIFDVFSGDGWEKLCKFINKPIPDLEFPHKRKAKYKKVHSKSTVYNQSR